MSAEKLDYQVVATTIMGALNECATVFLNVKPDKDPTIVVKDLYGENKFSVSTCSEFIDESYISAIHFYSNALDKKFKRSCGLFILYVDTSAINYLVNVFGFKSAAEAGWDMASDAVAELCGNIAGIFKRDLGGLGFPGLEVSIPLKFKGFCRRLDIPQGNKQYYRITSYVWGQTIVMDVILGF